MLLSGILYSKHVMSWRARRCICSHATLINNFRLLIFVTNHTHSLQSTHQVWNWFRLDLRKQVLAWTRSFQNVCFISEKYFVPKCVVKRGNNGSSFALHSLKSVNIRPRASSLQSHQTGWCSLSTVQSGWREVNNQTVTVHKVLAIRTDQRKCNVLNITSCAFMHFADIELHKSGQTWSPSSWIKAVGGISHTSDLLGFFPCSLPRFTTWM